MSYQRLARSNRTANRRAGFSMIELLTVLVIIGVVVSMSAGRISNYMTQQRVMRAAHSIQNDIEAAFAIAGRNRRPTRMSWDASAMAFRVTNRTGDTAFRTTVLGSSAYTLNSGNVSVSSTPIEIFPNGLASDTLLVTIAVTRGDMTWSRRIHVSRAGQVRID